MNRWQTFLRVFGPALGAGLLSVLVWLALFFGSGIMPRPWVLLSMIVGGVMIAVVIIYYQARGRLPGMGVTMFTILVVMIIPVGNLLIATVSEKLRTDTTNSGQNGSTTGKTKEKLIPPSSDEPDASGTVVGGPKVVVSNVSPDRINEWMLRYMAGPELGWDLMRRKWTGSIDMHGYLPLPIGPLLPGVKVEIQLSGTTLPCSPVWKVIGQDHERVQSARGERVQGASIGSDVVALFLEVRDIIGIPRQPIFGERIGFSGLECSATVFKLPSNAGLWVGSYSTCTANVLQTPGKVPFKLDGEGVDWTMRITFIPSEPVAPGAWELKETITVPGFYDTQQPRLWLLPENVTLDNSSPETLKASMDAVCVFKRELRPLFTVREGPTRDSFTITSEEVRRFWVGSPDKQVEWAEVHFQPPTRALVYWEMFFPVADAE